MSKRSQKHKLIGQLHCHLSHDVLTEACCRYIECSLIWTQTTDYFQVVGIILGQLTVGFLGDLLGRRWGMIQVAYSYSIVKHSNALALLSNARLLAMLRA